MAAEISGILLYFVFEILLALTSFRIQYIVFRRTIKKISDTELVIIWVAINIILVIMIASVLSFIQFNGVIQYLAALLFVFLIVHVTTKRKLIDYYMYMKSKITNISNKIFSWKIVVMFLIILPLLISIIHPIENVDSLIFLPYIFGWASNDHTPIVRAWNFVPIWEVAYLPSLVITDSDYFFWFTGIKPIFIIVMGAYVVSREIGIPKNLSLLIAFNGILFFIFWQVGVDPLNLGLGGRDNIGTLKNYHFVGAGIIMIALSILCSLRQDFSRLGGLLFILGIVFVTTKYTGILIAIISIILFIIFNRHNMRRFKKKASVWALIGFAMLILTTGHYYLDNYIERENPFYPVKINYFGIEFPGSANWSGSSLVSHLDELRMWKSVFPLDKISNAGLLFPITLTFGLVGTLGILGYSSWIFFKKRKLEYALLFLGLFIFFNWVIYFNTPLSAGPGGSDSIKWIKTLVSLKYVEVVLILTEIFFIYFLYRIGIPEKILFLVVGLNILSRILLLYLQLPSYFDYLILIYPIMIILALTILWQHIKKTELRLIILGSLGILVFISSPNIFEEHREKGWALFYDDVIKKIDGLPAKKIYLLDGPNYMYLFKGNNFQHTIEHTNSEIFGKKLIENDDFRPEYFIKICKQGRTRCTELLTIQDQYSQFGYIKTASDSHAALFKIKN